MNRIRQPVLSVLPKPASFGKVILFAIVCQLSAKAALEIDFITTRGTITAILEYQKTPKTAANLIALAEGNRNFVDPATGQVKRRPFFAGRNFYEVVNNSGEKTISTGSPTDLGGDGPGYAFPDELDPTLTHVPYVLSMSSSGPNTNGSCFSFTGNLPLASRDGRNTVFGGVPSAASRVVIDSILAAGSGTTGIVSVSVRRTDAAALAFDETTVGLPQVLPVESPLKVVPGVAVEWHGFQPAFSVLRAHQSTNLIDWSPHFRHMIGLDDVPPATALTIDGADVAARFYQFSLAISPDAGGVTSLASCRLAIDSPGTGFIVYQFNPEGTGGTYENILMPGEPPFFAGTFEVSGTMNPEFEPYSFRILLHANGLGGSPFNLICGGLDAVSPSKVSGRHVTRFLSQDMILVFEDAGNLELNRP